jgi:hypothetical protein
VPRMATRVVRWAALRRGTHNRIGGIIDRLIAVLAWCGSPFGSRRRTASSCSTAISAHRPKKAWNGGRSAASAGSTTRISSCSISRSARNGRCAPSRTRVSIPMHDRHRAGRRPGAAAHRVVVDDRVCRFQIAGGRTHAHFPPGRADVADHPATRSCGSLFHSRNWHRSLTLLGTKPPRSLWVISWTILLSGELFLNFRSIGISQSVSGHPCHWRPRSAHILAAFGSRAL